MYIKKLNITKMHKLKIKVSLLLFYPKMTFPKGNQG